MRTSSKKTSLYSFSSPDMSMIGRTVMPGVFMSTMNCDRPWCFGTVLSVRATRTPIWATWAREFQIFWPLTM